MFRRLWWVVLLAVVLAVVMPLASAEAQTTPGPPGPYVIDLRGAMVGVPAASEFYAALPTGAIIPGRGFGVDLGAHVFGPHVKGARLGLGVNGVVVQGRIGPPTVSARVTVVAPQVSLNFGTSDGWSYIGAGYGVGSISTRVTPDPDVEPDPDEVDVVEPRVDTGMVGTLNFGGGARWFVNRRVAAGFDVRFFRFSASSAAGTPATMRLALSVGLSVR